MSGFCVQYGYNPTHAPCERLCLIPLPLCHRPFIHPEQLRKLLRAHPVQILVPGNLAAQGIRFVIEGIVTEEGYEGRIVVELGSIAFRFPKPDTVFGNSQEFCKARLAHTFGQSPLLEVFSQGLWCLGTSLQVFSGYPCLVSGKDRHRNAPAVITIIPTRPVPVRPAPCRNTSTKYPVHS